MTERRLSLIEVKSLTAIEGHGPKRARWLCDKIKKEGIWSVPIKVERSNHLVMDGHHRFEVAKLMGLRVIPALLYDYDEVQVWSLRKNIIVNKEVILNNFKNGLMFPYKTAKHSFPVEDAEIKEISLHELF